MGFLKVLNAIKNIGLNVFRAFIDTKADDEIKDTMRAIGVAFGPKNAIYFPDLPKDVQQEWFKRVPILKERHGDWPPPFNEIPRAWTAWVPITPSDFPSPILAGTTTDLKPIPDKDEWYAAEGYLTKTYKDGTHVRLGFRPDYNAENPEKSDGYWNLTFLTIKDVDG